MNTLAAPHATTDPMQLRSEYVDNLVTTTWYDQRDQLFSDIWGITPLLDLLNEKGNIKSRLPVGRYFEIPIGYAKADQNQKWFGRGDTFGTQEKELWTTLQYVPKNFGDSIVRMWDDERKNKGKAQIMDYAKNLVDNHMMTQEETLQTALWDASGSDALALTGLPRYINSTPTTGVVGGIDRSKNPYMQNQATDYGAGYGTIDADLITAMTTMFNDCSKKKGKGRKSPDIILTTQSLYEQYEEEARALGQIQMGDANGSRRADLGFGGLSFKGAELYWDPECTADAMYFLNSSTMEFCYDPDAYMTMTEWKKKHDALDKYAQVVTVCELCFNNFQKNGILYNIVD